jgi:hypothetical protein
MGSGNSNTLVDIHTCTVMDWLVPSLAQGMIFFKPSCLRSQKLSDSSPDFHLHEIPR